jgi:hypothetical protein
VLRSGTSATFIGLAVVLTLACGRVPNVGGDASSISGPRSDAVRAEGFTPNGLGWTLSNGGLRTTVDDGDTWSSIQLPPGSNDWRAAALASDQTALVADLVSRGADVAITTNRGRSWTVSTLSTSTPDVAGDIALAFDGSVAAALVRFTTSSAFSAGEVFTTSDLITWVRHKAPTAGRIGLTSQGELWIAGGPSGDQLWSSHDLGVTWSKTALPQIGQRTVDVPRAIGNAVLILPVTVIGANGLADEIFLRTSDAINWTVLSRVRTSASMGPGSLLPTSISGNRFYVIEPSGSKTYATGPSGAIQAITSTGLPDGVNDVTFNVRGRGWARVDSTHCKADKRTCSSLQAIFRTLDGGRSWQRLSIGTST